MNKQLKIGVIGAGMHSQSNHGPALKQYRDEHPEEIELTAICDLDSDKAESYAQNFSFLRVYDNINLLLKKETLDAIVIVTPIMLTRKLVGEMLQYGIPLMFEKPPGKNAKETSELLSIAQKYNTPHMISFNRRFNPAVVKAREWLQQNGCHPSLILARMLRVSRCEPVFLTATGIHAVDTILSFMDEPVEVKSRKQNNISTVKPIISGIDFRNGAGACLIIAPDAGSDEETYELIGPKYSIRIDTLNCCLQINNQGKLLSWKAPEEMLPHVRGGAFNETKAFISACKNKDGFSPSLTEGLKSMLVTEAIDAGGVHNLSGPMYRQTQDAGHPVF